MADVSGACAFQLWQPALTASFDIISGYVVIWGKRLAQLIVAQPHAHFYHCTVMPAQDVHLGTTPLIAKGPRLATGLPK